MQRMSDAMTSSVVEEVIGHAVNCLLIAIERDSLGTVQRCAEAASKAVTDAFRQQPDVFAALWLWARVVRTLVTIAVPPTLSFLQRVHCGCHFGPDESACEQALINLVFCSITLCRCVGNVLSRSCTADGSHESEHMLIEHVGLQRRLCESLSSHFSLLSYAAEQQLWQLEASLVDATAEDLPALHTVPRTAMPLSLSSGWIWLLMEATTSAMRTAREGARETCGLTQTMEAMDPHDPHNAPFARKLADILLAVFAHFMRRWMTALPGLADAIRRVGMADAVSVLANDEKISIKDLCRVGSSEEEMWVPVEMCILLRDLLERVPTLFVSPSPALRLLQVAAQISAVRLYIAARHPVGAAIPPVVNSLAAEFSQLLEAAAAKFTILAASGALPPEANLPCLQMAFFDLAGKAYESTASCEISVAPAVAAVRCALVLCRHGADTDADIACADAVFAQSFTLALGETFAHVWTAGGSSPRDAASTHRFFLAARSVLHNTTELSTKVKSAALDDIIGFHLTVVEHIAPAEQGTTPVPLHRSYWLLAVSYLRMADMLAQALTQPRQSTCRFTASWFDEHDTSARWFCSQAESMQRLRGEEPKVRFQGGGLPRLRGRLVMVSRRFLLMALYEATRIERLFAETNQSGPILEKHVSDELQTVSQASEYYSTYIGFLQLMDNVPAEEVIRSSRIFQAALEDWRKNDYTYNTLVTDTDMDAARSYQLAETLFLN